MSRSQAQIALAFIVLFGFFARAATFKSPLLDHHAWRQADTASIARNFHRERFNILYPQIDWRGPQATGYVATGLEVPAFVVASVARLGGFHPEMGRVLSSLTFIASALLVWSFTRRRYGQTHAIVAVFVYAFGFPLMLYMERAFMNEALLVCLSLACLTATQKYLETGRAAWWLLVCATSALVAAIKLPYVIILAPVTGLFLEKRGLAVWKSWELWLVVATNLAAAAAWYTHAHRLALQTGFTFGLFDKAFDANLAFSLQFASKIGRRLLRDILGPVGLAAAVGGLALALRSRRWCEVLGVAGFVVYLALVPGGNFAHDYYQVALMPIAPALVALGLGGLHDRVTRSRRFGPRASGILAGVLMLVAVSTFVRLSSFHSWFYYGPQDVEFCESVQALGQPSDRVIFVAQDADPKWLFCVDRKGWVLAGHDATVHRLQTARNEGATLAFLSKSASMAEIDAYLAQSGVPVPLDGPFRVYRLR